MTKIDDKIEDAIKEVEITYLRVDTGQRELRVDFVAVEEPLHLIIGQEHYVTILSTPFQKRELVIGHLITEGMLKKLDEIKEIRISAEKCEITLRSDVKIKERLALTVPFQRVIASACATPEEWPLYKLIDRLKIPKVTSSITVAAKIIAESTKKFSNASTIHSKTGGVHAAAIHRQDGEVIAFAEDVGRHNAIDKAVGIAVTNHCDLAESFLVSTGRVTGDIALKAARTAIPIVASLAAAVNSGIEVAQRTELTLIGFVRGNRMNIYTHPERLI
ncbi:MAG: formate dehydrogenase accessory sulfurtransferase FdhD [Candidatus Bathyarchaeota archaeon]